MEIVKVTPKEIRKIFWHVAVFVLLLSVILRLPENLAAIKAFIQ